MKLRFLSSLLFLLPLVSTGGEVEISGSVADESRTFFEEPQFPGQVETWQPSVIVEPEFFYETDDRDQQYRFSPYFRFDFQDDERTHFDIREANWRYMKDDWDLFVGIGKVFWGVTESQHLVDIINQDDFVEDIDREDKLGQQMINLSLYKKWGTLNLFVLPGFRERTFAGRDGRFRTPLTISDDPTYDSSAENGHVDFAIRYAHSIGNWDVGAYYFHGTGREPRFLPSADGNEIVPHYDIIDQGGIDIQYTHEALLLKLEAIARGGHGDTFGAFAGGFEYTFYQIFDSSSDLGLLAEYHRDGRDEDAPPTLFQNDVFAGARWSMNDTQDSALLFGVVKDTESDAATLFVEFERRIRDDWKIEIEGRFIANGHDDPLLDPFANDSFLTVRLSRFF
ncbi:MAG: hypothetical protein ACI8UO_005429 [Verrucomicrobiales bacterium]|jgi:hypothetical protein